MLGSPPARSDVCWSKSGSALACAWKPYAHLANMAEAPATSTLADCSPSSSRLGVSGVPPPIPPPSPRSTMLSDAATSSVRRPKVCRTMNMASGGSCTSCSQLVASAGRVAESTSVKRVRAASSYRSVSASA